jgi:hypothetical protein
MDENNLDGVLEGVDEERRAALRSIIVKTAFAAPVVATFAMGGLAAHAASLYSVNTTQVS